MVNGDKPGQRTWYVGDEDDAPDTTTSEIDATPDATQDVDHGADVVEVIPLTNDAKDNDADNDSDTPDLHDASTPDPGSDEPAVDTTASDSDAHPSEATSSHADITSSPDATDDAPASDGDSSEISDDKAKEIAAVAELEKLEAEADAEELARADAAAKARDDHRSDYNEELESTLVHRQSLLNIEPEKDKDEVDAPATDDDSVDPDKQAATQEAEEAARKAEAAAKESLQWDKDNPPTDREREEAIFDGATVLPAVPSRAAAHLWSLVLTIILLPVTWYLTWDAASRLTLPSHSQARTGVLDAYALTELGGAVVALFVLVLLARWSSLGAFIGGLVLVAGGLPFLIMPATTAERLEPILHTLQQQSPFTGNIAHHLQWSGTSGFLVMAGIALLGLGFVSHGARRKGRKDFLAKRKVERTKRSRGIKD